MRNYRILFVIALIIVVLLIIINANSFQGEVAAAPLSKAASVSTQQITGNNRSYRSVSLFEFVPLNTQDSLHTIDSSSILLTLGAKSDHNFTNANNIFEAPLNLPDNVMLTGFTIFGVDNDNQGEVKVTLGRCNHNLQIPCQEISLSSDVPNSLGPFQTQTPLGFIPIPIRNQDNFYFLELEITALNNSGLRSVRLQFADNGESISTSSNLPENPVVPWNLNANELVEITSPTSNPITVRVCVDAKDASFIDRPEVRTGDASSNPVILNFGDCRDFTGRYIQIRGNGRTTTSGYYQRLQ